MAQTKYTVTNVDPIGFKNLSSSDSKIIDSFEINSKLNLSKDVVELHVYSIDGELLESNYNYQGVKFLQGSETADNSGGSFFTLDPIDDIEDSEYENGGVVYVYNFLRDLYSESTQKIEFYIKEISPDRKEIRLLTTQLDSSTVEEKTSTIKSNFEKLSYHDNLRLNFQNNNIVAGVNIKTLAYKDYKSVIVKLYERLPESINLKDKLSIQQIITDSVAYQIDAETVSDVIEIPYIKGPNFESEFETNESNIPSQLFNYNELFSYPTQNSYRELNSLFAEKGISLSIDYSDYSEFINFSSINERLRNFKYKLDLIEGYQTTLNEIESGSNTVAGISGSRDFYKNEIKSILDNFDHYDRHLYYESGPTSWPKQNTLKPYINATGSATGSWYADQLLSSSTYDDTNNSLLLNTVPVYLREDPDNAPYATFIHMIAQHFDNIWIYTKAVTDKYDNDNRLNKGISKDLVEDALRNFGIKLYTSNKSTEDLFKTFTGELYNTGSEQVVNFTSASNDAISEENYRKELYKRLYHNLPLLLKSKGTERGVRALLNSFGIPTLYSSGSHTGLKVKSVGGSNTTENVNIGPLLITTSSAGKVRLDDTGSTTTGNTLSQYTSILKRDQKYSNDSHAVEIGYSQTDVINEAILNSLSSSSYNIDEFIGDPNLAGSSSYADLISSSNSILENILTGSNNQQDFTRILKFYDNVVFKTVKDFIPARSNLSTGIIVKPHILERNKAKQVTGEFSFNEYSGSVVSGSRSGSSGASFGGRDQYSTAYSESIITPDGLATYTYHNQEEPKYDGELSGSYIVASTSELNNENIYKYDQTGNALFKYSFISDNCGFTITGSLSIVTPTPTPTTSVTPTPSPADCNFTISGSLGAVTPTPTPTTSITPTPTPTPSPADCNFTISGSLNPVTPTPTPSTSTTPTPTPTPSTTSAVDCNFTISGSLNPVTPTPTPSTSTIPTPTPTPTLSTTPPAVPSPTPTVSITPTPSTSTTPTPTPTPTLSTTPPAVTPPVTPTISITPTISVTPSITPTITPSTNYNEYTISNCGTAGGGYSDVRVPVGSGVGPGDVVLMPDGCYQIDDAPIGSSANDYIASYIDCSACQAANPTPTPTPTISNSATPTQTPTNTPTPTPSLSEGGSPTPTPTPTNTPTVTPSRSVVTCIAIEVGYSTGLYYGCCAPPDNNGIKYFNANSVASATRLYSDFTCSSLESGTIYVSEDQSTYYEFFNGVKVGSAPCPGCP